jgi:cytochrome bd-type quinol oxidase subunit 2
MPIFRKLILFSVVTSLLFLGANLAPVFASPAPSPSPSPSASPTGGGSGTTGSISSGVSAFGGLVYGGQPSSPQKIAALLIKSALALLGIVFVVLIIYAGFLYLTSQGKEDQIKTAKKIMFYAIIGITIIIISYAIASFVINAVSQSVGPGYQGGTP